MKNEEGKMRDYLSSKQYSKAKMEFMGRSAARVTIEDYYSKTYFENLVKCVIYKGNETVISNDDDRHWLNELVFCITEVSKIVIKPFGRKLSASYYAENFFFGWGGDERKDYWLHLEMWKKDDGKYYPDFVCEPQTADKIYDVNLKISEFFSPLLTQHKALKPLFVDCKLSDFIYGTNKFEYVYKVAHLNQKKI